jgi:hypothetical protein
MALFHAAYMMYQQCIIKRRIEENRSACPRVRWIIGAIGRKHRKSIWLRAPSPDRLMAHRLAAGPGTSLVVIPSTIG